MTPRIAASLLAMLCIAATHARAEDLVEIWQLARTNDPGIRAAEARWSAAREAVPQARSALLPQAGVSGDTTGNRQDVQTSGVGNEGVTRFNSNRLEFGVSQTVFDRGLYQTLREADARVAAAAATLQDEWQSLMIEVATRYFAVLAAEDRLELTRAHLDAIGRQEELARARFDVGLGTITDVHEARARFDLARADVLAAENGIEAAREQLRVLTGSAPGTLDRVAVTLALDPPDPPDLGAWEQRTLDHQPRIVVTMRDAEAARAAIEVARSGHLPTVELVADYAAIESGGRFGSSDTDQSSIGLVFNLPLYEGGRVNSLTRERRAQLMEALEREEQTRRDVLRETRDAWREILSGIRRVEALAQALKSNETALEAMQTGFEAGVRTIVDVLDAQRDLYRARGEYLLERYRYIESRLRLLRASGLLADADLARVNGWLE